jgi:prolyl-tRNA synthetase
MTHSDDQGFVCPPKLAPEQVVIVPIWNEDNRDEVLDYAEGVAEDLDDAGVRVELDDRDERNPGFKFNEWELKGVPVRIEIGPNEVEDDELTVVHRPDGEDTVVDREGIGDTIRSHFDQVYAKLYDAAKQNLEENVREAYETSQILGTIGQHGGYVQAPWCGDEACETVVKEEIAAEIVMVPMDRDEEPIGDECAVCGDEACETAYFAKSY